jgi:protein phosphatase
MHIRDPQTCADRMIELALRGGGPDNVTVIIADVIDVDFGDDAPIVGGAAGDGSDDGPPPDSPAARARALNPIPPPQQRLGPPAPAQSPKSKRRKLIRAALAGLAVLVILGGGALFTRYLVLRQYYVAVADNGEIGIFQGVRGSFLGIKLQREIEGSCPPNAPGCEMITVDDLKQGARDNVRNGIAGLQSQQEAEEVIRRLRTDQVLAECPKPTPTTTATPVPAPPPATTATGHLSNDPTASTAQTTPAQTTPAQTTAPSATPALPGLPGGLPFTDGTPATGPTPTGTPTHTLTPGVDCRKAGN